MKQTRSGQPGGVSIPKPADESDWDHIYEQLIGCLSGGKSEKRRTDALARLVAKGCSARVVVQNLYMFCGGQSEEILATRKSISREHIGILEIVARLRELSSDILVAEAFLVERGITHTLLPDQAALAKLGVYAGFLASVSKAGRRNVASGRITGRDQHLVFLCRMVVKATGRPHFAEIAELINEVKLFYNHESSETETAESVRKRFSRQPPNYAVELELEMMQEMGYFRAVKKLRH